MIGELWRISERLKSKRGYLPKSVQYNGIGVFFHNSLEWSCWQDSFRYTSRGISTKIFIHIMVICLICLQVICLFPMAKSTGELLLMWSWKWVAQLPLFQIASTFWVHPNLAQAASEEEFLGEMNTVPSSILFDWTTYIYIYELYTHISGWWFGTWILFSQKYWVANHPNRLSYFSEGWPNHQPVYIYIYTRIIYTYMDVYDHDRSLRSLKKYEFPPVTSCTFLPRLVTLSEGLTWKARSFAVFQVETKMEPQDTPWTQCCLGLLGNL